MEYDLEFYEEYLQYNLNKQIRKQENKWKYRLTDDQKEDLKSELKVVYIELLSNTFITDNYYLHIRLKDKKVKLSDGETIPEKNRSKRINNRKAYFKKVLNNSVTQFIKSLKSEKNKITKYKSMLREQDFYSYDPETGLDELFAMVEEFITEAKLTKHEHSVYVQYKTGLSFVDISELLSLSERYVRTLFYRAEHKVDTYLKNEYDIYVSRKYIHPVESYSLQR